MSQFTPSGSSGSTTNVVVSGATTPQVARVSIVSANTEYSYALPTNTKKYTIRLQDMAQLKVAFQVGQSGTDYIPLPSNGIHWEDNLSLTGISLYFQSPSPTQLAIITIWT